MQVCYSFFPRFIFNIFVLTCKYTALLEPVQAIKTKHRHEQGCNVTDSSLFPRDAHCISPLNQLDIMGVLNQIFSINDINENNLNDMRKTERNQE